MTDFTPKTDTIQIPLTRGYIAIVDECDSDLVDFKWFLLKGTRTQYARRNGPTIEGKRDTIRLHRVVIQRVLGRELLKDEIVDHINRDGLDNRRCNLRIVTRSENTINSRLRCDNTSGYRGVDWDRQVNRWRVQVNVNGTKFFLGSFNDIKDAARAYNQGAIKYHGEFAMLNEIADSE